ncbi:hypothetical protein [Streptomyces sp. NPDC001970]
MCPRWLVYAIRYVHPFMARHRLRRTHRALALAAPPAAERLHAGAPRAT